MIEPITTYSLEMTSKSVYGYFKEKLGLVPINYARKVLGVSRDKFKKLVEQHQLEVFDYPAPIMFRTKLYSLKKIYELKKKLEEENAKTS